MQSENTSSDSKKPTSTATKPKNKTSSAIKHYVSNTPSSKISSSKAASKVSSSESVSSEEEVIADEEDEQEKEQEESEEEKPASKVQPTPKSENTSIVNLNSATKEEFMTLVGIGEVTAGNIIAFRDQIGSFASIEEIKEVKGIGDKTYDKIKHRLTV